MNLVGDGYRVLVIVVIIAVAVALLALLPSSILQDTWLALVAGREVAEHGIPHHVTLTVLASGHAWVDQQWLAQLCMYGSHQLGGLALVGVVNVALIAGGLAAGVLGASRLGAGQRAILRVLSAVGLLLALVPEVRTQPYAYPLFALVVYLLASDARRPSRAVFWCLPVLVLWGNLHGSASLGAGLVALRGLTLLWELRSRLTRLGWGWLRVLVLVVGAPACLLVTPYGGAMIGYYRATLANPAFRSYVSEWRPITSSTVIAVVFFALLATTLWSFGRHRGATTLWERAALLIMAAGAILAVRNVVWFDLAVLMLLPVSIDSGVRGTEFQAPSRPLLNLTLLGACGVAVVVLAVRPFALVPARLTPSYPAGALAAVRSATAADPGMRIFADERYADWLLWELPYLRGRIAYDASFEVLSGRQLQATEAFKQVVGLGWQRIASGYRMVVVSTALDPDVIAVLRRWSSARFLYDRDSAAVIER